MVLCDLLFQEMETSIKDEPEMVAQLALGLAGVSSVPLVWSQSGGATVQAPHAHMSTVSQQLPAVPPPAHAHSSTTNQKPPDTFLDKGLIEAAAYLDGKSMSLPLKTADNSASTESSSGLPWSIQNALFQQYGQFMLDRMLTKQSESVNTVTATATTDSVAVSQASSPLSTLPTSQAGGKALDSDSEPGAIEAQRDVYRRMLNYSSALTQQYYLSQYGYNYMQDRTLFSKAEPGQTSTVTTATASHTSSNQSSLNHNSRAQLPSIDSVLLNLSTKKSTTTTASAPQGSGTLPSTASIHSIPANYGLQALANAAIEADPKAFSEAEPERKDGQKSELEDITDTDDSNTMSPSDGSTGHIMSPSRNTYGHLMDNPPISIPAAHSHSQQYSSLYQTKSAVGTLPSIQHFAALGKTPTLKVEGGSSGLQLPLATGIKPSDLVAAAMKLKSEPSEEKEIADRAIQERITAHHLNAVQQQVQDLTAGALAAGNIDAAALLAKLQSANLESELQKQMERVYDYEESVQSMQHEPMELTADGGSPGRISRRKSRGRPTSIESLRDPLGRQSSTTSSLGANTSISGDGDDRTYDCEICGKQFSHNDRLRRHRKIHTSEKPYKCDICGKGFKEKCNLKHHRYIHTGEKPYKCDTCGKSFNQRSSLKTHQKVHTGEKPFKCELCDKPFAQKYLLRQHMKKHIEINMPPQQQQQ